jgi:hypothetical protein
MSNFYGTDLFLVINSNGTMDVDPTMRETSGFQVLAQSLVMRQFTPTGSLIGAPDECVDIRSWLSKGMTLSQVQQLGAVVQAQLLRDPRVKAAQVSGTFNTSTSTLTLTENITGSQGPFTLTISVSQLTVSALLNGVPLGGGGGAIPVVAPTPTATSPVATGIAGSPGPQGATGSPGPPGPIGPSGMSNIAIQVPFGPASASSAADVPAGAVVTSTLVLIETPFSGGTSPTVAVSVNGQSVFPTADADLTTAGTYSSLSVVTITATAPVVVTFGGSATAGSGTVIVLYNSVVS